MTIQQGHPDLPTGIFPMPSNYSSNKSFQPDEDASKDSIRGYDGDKHPGRGSKRAEPSANVNE